MTGYRRVLSCGEPCAEEFDCINCIIGTTNNFCHILQEGTCPSTLSVAITAPAITFTSILYGCTPPTSCYDSHTVPAIDETIVVTKNELMGSCYYDGLELIDTYTYTNCAGTSSTASLRVEVIISANNIIPFGMTNMPAIAEACPDYDYCEAYVISVRVYNVNPITTTQYGFAAAFVGNEAASCEGSTRCYNEYGSHSGVISSWTECDGSWACCDDSSYMQRYGAIDPSDCSGGHVRTCSLPTGFTISRPV